MIISRSDVPPDEPEQLVFRPRGLSRGLIATLEEFFGNYVATNVRMVDEVRFV